MSKFTKKCMICPAGHTFLCKFWHFQMAVPCLLLGRFTPNLRFLWIFVCSFRLRESIVASSIIYRLVPSPSRCEIRQCQRNIFRHCWPNILNAFGHRVAICCNMLAVVGSSLKMPKFESTVPPNMSQQVGQTHAICCANSVVICCVGMLRSFGPGLTVEDFKNKEKVQLGDS